ncbi:imm11 family protein [Pseudovibrio ascidiaceicola]|uniref:imm11 family protein n=1 Tax=Pseudovibrio ascidiaceicola TaxID=285279 RepID=UPI000D69FFA9|nr:DUF1629 domain-containing protein [Pseudovibrio ascidiaceicola]
MPYFVQSSIYDKDSVPFQFEPDFPIELQRPFSQGANFGEDVLSTFPKTMMVSPRSGPKIPDIIGWNNNPLFLSERLKNKIEELEPNIHLFLPIRVVDRKRKIIHGRYYYLVLREKLDPFDYVKTNFWHGFGLEAAKSSGWEGNWAPPRAAPLFVHTDKIAGRHLWRGTDETSKFIYFCSDQLRDFIKSNKIRGWTMYPCQLSQK